MSLVDLASDLLFKKRCDIDDIDLIELQKLCAVDFNRIIGVEVVAHHIHVDPLDRPAPARRISADDFQ
ncbi:hypothetical protein [Geodermatophilus aquaeductus]